MSKYCQTLSFMIYKPLNALKLKVHCISNVKHSSVLSIIVDCFSCMLKPFQYAAVLPNSFWAVIESTKD